MLTSFVPPFERRCRGLEVELIRLESNLCMWISVRASLLLIYGHRTAETLVAVLPAGYSARATAEGLPHSQCVVRHVLCLRVREARVERASILFLCL